MTTMHIHDISHKRTVSSKYTPNSYRIFCEDIGNESVPIDYKYSSQAPKIYSQPLIIPAQAIEDRNYPHAGRGADFLRENARTLNEPVNRISSKNVPSDAEKRWWEWNLPVEDPNWKNKKRAQSLSGQRDPNSSASAVANPTADTANFQTTYQKEHGYLKNVLQPGNKVGNVNENFGAAQRHTYNPNNAQAVGIVPVNDLNSFTKDNEPQRVLVDRVSFEQAYDSRNDNNYPMRGRRHGAFVLEQVEPRQSLGTKNRPDSNKNNSMWDLMHPGNAPVGNLPPKPQQIYQKPPSGKQDSGKQRRDPIGYFEDSKYGGSFGSNMARDNSFTDYPATNGQMNGAGAEHNPGTPQQQPYQPSWDANTLRQQMNGGQSQPNPNELFENAMRPLVSNGYKNN